MSVLPVNHRWYNKTPVVSNKHLLYGVIGSSNHAVGAQDDTYGQPYNTFRNKIYKHNDTLVGFSDPPNDQSVTTYSRLDETGTQNYTSFLSEMLRLSTDKIPVAVTAGQSGTGIANTITGYNSSTTLQQTEDLFAAAKAKTGASVSFVCVGVSDGDMKFNQISETVTSLITSYLSNLRDRLDQPDLPVILIAPGLTPPSYGAVSEGGDGTYPSWTINNTAIKAVSISNTFVVNTDSLDVATYRTSDEVHRNAIGNKAVAELIYNQYLLI